jgi:MFS family permease
MAAVTHTEVRHRARTDTLNPLPLSGQSRLILVAAVIGFFVVTLDAVAVNVALPSIRHAFGGGISGLQWVVDAYTLAFAGLLLWAGALSDRVGASRAFTVGAGVFAAASAGCGLAPSLGWLVAARFVQGSAAAVLMPASMALISRAFREGPDRARAVALWAMGGVAASTSGPLLGGLLTVVSWRLIFFINLPAGAAAVVLAARMAPSPRRQASFDWAGQLTGVAGMGAVTYGAIEAGAVGFAAPQVLAAFAAAVVSLAGFLKVEARVAHPMVPLDLVRCRSVAVPVAVGFAFVVGFYGASVRDEPLSSAGAPPLPVRHRGGVSAYGAHRRRAHSLQRSPGRAPRPPEDHRRRPGGNGSRPGPPRRGFPGRAHLDAGPPDDAGWSGRADGDATGHRDAVERHP